MTRGSEWILERQDGKICIPRKAEFPDPNGLVKMLLMSWQKVFL